MIFISLVTLAFLISFADAQNCTALAAEGNCDFYPQCVETRIPCGTSGYALNYGERYCTRFTDQLNCFTSEVYVVCINYHVIVIIIIIV